MDKPIRAKKHLGQHFLKDENIARKIAFSLSLKSYSHILEIGPGMGILTRYLLEHSCELVAMDLDKDSIQYLTEHFKSEKLQLVEADFLKSDPSKYFNRHQFAIVGNFPYNISSQILFKMLEWRQQVPELVGMYQKELAERVCVKEGSKTYGIISVLVQAFYEAEYLFTVKPGVFLPPPKVESGVIRLKRKPDYGLKCDEKMFFRVVKTAFQQRRKTLRNSLKSFQISDKLKEDTIFAQRPEQLSVEAFINLTFILEQDAISNNN